jgi:hypothetical protein
MRTIQAPNDHALIAIERRFKMRRNSGDDHGRDLDLDPTEKEHERERGKSGAAVLDPHANEGAIENERGQRTTGMGSRARKSEDQES